MPFTKKKTIIIFIGSPMQDRRFPVLTPEEAKKWDEISIKEKGVEAILLMGHAGFQMAQWIQKNLKEITDVHIFCGGGNNGGDGYALAYYLKTLVDIPVYTYPIKEPSTKEAKYFASLASKVAERKLWSFFQERKSSSTSLIVDALLGIGFSRELREDIASFIRFLNQIPGRKLAVDIPSGVYASGDFFSHEAFYADYTLTFGGYKVGHLIEPGIFYVGELIPLPIGFYPIEFSSFRRLRREKFSFPSLRKLSSYKYRSGSLLLLGGSPGMEGASILASYSFLKSGGGMAYIFSPSKDIKKGLRELPEALYRYYQEEKVLEKEFLTFLKRHLPKPLVVLLGVGLDFLPSQEFWKELLSLEIPVIIDGSLLHKIRPLKDMLSSSSLSSLILTPHKKEAESLLGRKLQNIRKDALEIAKEYKAYVYLKGPGGILTSYQEEEIYFFSHASSLAIGGSGDILSGIIASFLLRYPKDPLRALEEAISFHIDMAEEKTPFQKDFFLPTDIFR